ncbi:acylneuraminate cytidylyltransferase family protein [uncultured Cetobacterium sp.]|uniref:acylneuraminate cytidylyltransferase family protein n=1 Tax=uncultured Cetobacterium sp. TaxID=527638 RepID=UPI00262EEDAF|nr:acylneuraminate cytidylyltransferase family protein [uncultured Cetobacterium sp.]
MYKNKRILAIIPARGGSKGIPKKNIIDILNKPLLHYSIKSAKESKYLDKIIISTDDKEIAEVAENLGIDVPFLRPEELATDTSKSIEAFIHSIKEEKKNGNIYDYILLLQNTSPLRQGWHIDEAIEKLLESNERSLVSVNEVNEHPSIMRTIANDGILKNLIDSNGDIRRQDFSKIYIVNGAIYIQKNDNNLNLETNLNGGDIPYIMEHKYSIDIDNYLDLEIATHYLKEMTE